MVKAHDMQKPMNHQSRHFFVETPMTAKVEGMFWLITADRAAELTISAARKRRAVVYIPGRWCLMMFVIRSIPSFVFRKLSV